MHKDKRKPDYYLSSDSSCKIIKYKEYKKQRMEANEKG